MKKKIYDYIKKHPLTTCNKCATELGIEDIKALKYFNKLQDEGYIQVEPIPLSENSESSCFYFAIKDFNS